MTPALAAVALALAPLQVPAEVARLSASDAEAGDAFGAIADFDGTTAVVGLPLDENGGVLWAGIAYVYERDHGGPGSWGEVAQLVAFDAADFDQFGYSVAVSGDTIVVGSRRDDHAAGNNAGSAYVFERDLGGPGAWGLAAKLIASDAEANDSFGSDVAICGDTLVVGAPTDDVPGFFLAGSAYVFERDLGGPGAWGEAAVLVGSTVSSNANSGPVAIHQDTIVLGAGGDFHSALFEIGSAWVFERDAGGPGNWGEVAVLTADDGDEYDHFGVAVAVFGDRALIGAWTDDHSGFFDAGSAYLFERDLGGPNAWGQAQKLTASDPQTNVYFGSNLALSADDALVGVASDDPGGLTDAGSVYRFEPGGGALWSETMKLAPESPAAGDAFGASVALAGAAALVGAPGHDHAGGVDAGSAYVLVLPAPFEGYCTAGTSASGCLPVLAAAGTASASLTSGFFLTAAGVEGDKDGLFFHGANGRQASPWGGGTSYQCVVPPVRRAGLLAAGGTPGLCDGAFAQDLNARWCPTCPKPAANPGAGATVQAQLWYRDPLNTSNRTTSLSAALEFTLVP